MYTIIIDKDKCIFKGKVLKDTEIEQLLIRKKSKGIRIIILGENILVKICDNINGNIKRIEDFIEGNFLIDDNTLIDYEFNKKTKKAYIYSLKQGQKIDKFIQNTVKVEVIPFQYLIKKVIKSKFNVNNNFQAIISLREYLYFIETENGNIISSFIFDNNKETLYKILKTKIWRNDVFVNIELRSYIEEEELNDKITFINFMEKLNYEI